MNSAASAYRSASEPATGTSNTSAPMPSTIVICR